MFIQIAHAQSTGLTATSFIQTLAREIINPIILVLMALALLIFLWGLVEFIREGDSVETRNKGRTHMFWGIIGLFIMVSAYAILDAVATSVFGR